MRASILTLTAASLLSVPAYAKTLQCNKHQTRCVTEDQELTIGDQVGIFNSDGELVAEGEVKAMKGERRAVLINKRHGAIRRDYKLSLLEGQASDASPSAAAYKIYKEPAKTQVGAELGYSSVSIGGGSPATEFSAFGQMRKWGGMQLVGRFVYEAVEGEVQHDDGDQQGETLPMSMTGIGLLGGAGYVVREGKPISFRGEVAGGAMHVSATIGGDSGLVGEEGSNAKVDNGFNLYGRWTLGAVLNMDIWHVHADVAQSLVKEAFHNTIALGLSRDLK